MSKGRASKAATFVERDRAWLAARGDVPDTSFERVQHYQANAKLAGDLILEAEPSTCVVVDGDLEVAGDIYVCGDGLWVSGEIRCSTFESWDARFVIARAIRARRDIAFTAVGGAPHEVGRFEAPVFACVGGDREDLLGEGEHRIAHVLDLSDAPTGVGDAMVLELLRTRTDEVVARLDKGEAIWSLCPAPPPRPSTRLTKIAEAIAAGATFEWTDLGGRPAIKVVTPDGVRQLSALSAEERQALERLLAERSP